MSGYLPTKADLRHLADRLDRAAAVLEHTAAHAAQILPARAGGTGGGPAAWARQKQQGALVARETAAGLRREADDPVARPSAGGFAQAEVIAKAAEMDGILIDGRPLAEAKALSTSIFDQDERRLWEREQHPTQLKAALIESTGMFGYVAGDPDRRPQVPFWVLGGPRRPTACTCLCDHDGGCLACGCVCPDPGRCPCCGTT